MTRTRPYDPGLQPERTTLAWRRTTISLMLGSLVALRLLPPVLGQWSIAISFLGLGLAAFLWRQAARRANHTADALETAAQLPDGTLLLQLGITVSGAGLLALLYILR
jgi:putative membrane protein